jgi:hypothetical protein
VASDFPAAFAALRAILHKHSSGMLVQTDTPTEFSLLSPAVGPNKKLVWFGAVYLKKSAVTYHLMPLYFNPALGERIPDQLRARKQGKSCFNFARPDPAMFAQLDELTRLAREAWKRNGFLEAGSISRERFEAAVDAAGGDAAALARERKRKGAAAAAKRAATIARNKTRSGSPVA